MAISTINPYTGEKLGVYDECTDSRINSVIVDLHHNYMDWKQNINLRVDYFKSTLKPNLLESKHELAKLMSAEMGKPISQSLAEIDKCINLVDYAVQNYVQFLDPEFVDTEGKKTYVRFDPLGTILLVMPWNFPLWQVMRAAVPAMLAGNTIMLKHASIVTGTSLMIEKIFESPAFKSIVASGPRALSLIPKVDGVSFTGSTAVGKSIAQEAGKYLKKAVLELGGSDPFIVLKSADINEVAEKAVLARMQNNGQSCIASKRFLVHEEILDEFLEKVSDKFSSIKIGDPLDNETFLGPLSSKEQTSLVSGQIKRLSSIGSVKEFGKAAGGIIPPTLAEITGKFDEEIFGPVAIITKFNKNEDAVRIANDTPYGLGSSIWGSPEEAEEMAPKIEAGMVFVNKVVGSDPRVPFGGIKQSGLGRELSRFGLREFTNIKTVWIDH
jgi:acyl-CoA reductase-like NAD-dependent aldehyde dehydrogenase